MASALIDGRRTQVIPTKAKWKFDNGMFHAIGSTGRPQIYSVGSGSLEIVRSSPPRLGRRWVAERRKTEAFPHKIKIFSRSKSA